MFFFPPVLPLRAISKILWTLGSEWQDPLSPFLLTCHTKLPYTESNYQSIKGTLVCSDSSFPGSPAEGFQRNSCLTHLTGDARGRTWGLLHVKQRCYATLPLPVVLLLTSLIFSYKHACILLNCLARDPSLAHLLTDPPSSHMLLLLSC